MSRIDNVVYLSYGTSPHTYEVIFAMLTLARFPGEELRGLRTFAVTDQPDQFRAHGLEVLPVSSETIDDWKGTHRFGHRCKIFAIKRVIEQFGGKCLLVDGDTYWTRPPGRIFRRIGPSRSVMHMPLGRLADSRLEQSHRFGELLEIGEFGGNGRGAARGRGRWTVQWNAGVVGVDSADAHLLGEVLDFVDRMLPRFWAPAVEQLAFSIILAERTRLQPSRDAIFHYNVSPDRESFRDCIPDLLARSAGMPARERAHWLYAHRLKLSRAARARILAKDVLNTLHLMPARDRCDCL
jgi:hypothetical protein